MAFLAIYRLNPTVSQDLFLWREGWRKCQSAIHFCNQTKYMREPSTTEIEQQEIYAIQNISYGNFHNHDNSSRKKLEAGCDWQNVKQDKKKQERKTISLAMFTTLTIPTKKTKKRNLHKIFIQSNSFYRTTHQDRR